MKANRILVPLDGSALAEMALPNALEVLSEDAGATLILLRAAEAPAVPAIDPIEAQVAVIPRRRVIRRADRTRRQRPRV